MTKFLYPVLAAVIYSFGVGATSPIFHIESFGDTEATLEIPGELKGISLTLEGPFENADSPSTGKGKAIKVGKRGKAHLSLSEKGVYRIKVEGGSPELRVTCQKKCGPETYLPSVLFKKLSKEKKSTFLNTIEAKIREKVVDDKLEKHLLEQVQAVRANELSATALDDGIHFPTLSYESGVAEFLEERQWGKHVNSPKVESDLKKHLASQPLPRNTPLESVATSPVDLRYGHFLSRAVTQEQLDHSQPLSSALTALGSKNGSWVKIEDPKTKQTYEAQTPRQLLEGLIKTGHRIELRQERTYANFAAFVAEGEQVRLPVWIDTGITLPSGRKLRVPMGHSEFVYEITGPLVNTRVAFYQGMYGTGFFPKVDARPDWTGNRVVQRFDSQKGDGDIILDATDIATKYLRRIQLEAETIAKGLPAQGYAITGVCNNSVALMQKALGREDDIPLSYPLLRSKKITNRPEELKSDPRFQDGLDEIFSALPSDADMTPEEREANKWQILCRILAMSPYPLNSPIFRETGLEEYQRDLKEVKKWVGNRCSKGGQSREASPTH
jgi:hypothetical protein